MSGALVVGGLLAGVAVRLLQAFPAHHRDLASETAPRVTRPGSVRRLLLALVAGAGAALVVPGTAGAAAGVVVAAVAWQRLGRLVPAAELQRRRVLATELPIAVDLLAGAVRSGTDPVTALAAVADAVAGPVGAELDAVGQRLRLGADPGVVWRDLGSHPQLGPLGRSLARAHRSGSSVVVAADRLAAELRELHRTEVEARASSVSTRAAAPLGLCFLPAFVLLGIVPLVAGLLGSLR